VTLRAGSSAVVFAVVVIAVVLLTGDAVLKGAWPVAARTAGIGALVVWVAWMLLWRPSIRVLPDRAVVVNVGRIAEVPWTRVVDIRRRLQLILDLDDGQRVEAWGSPFPRRRPIGPSARTDDRDPGLMALRGAWAGAAPEAGAVVRRTDVHALLIGVAAVLALVLGLAVGR
jgi:hypothetical protein